MEEKINIQEGDGNFNAQINLNFPEEDMGIISEIIGDAIVKHENILNNGLNAGNHSLDLELLEKIEFNFKNDFDKKYVIDLCEDFYDEIHIFEEIISSKSTSDQEILTKGVRSQYKSFLHEENNVLNSLKKLFSYYIPSGKEKNPKYSNYSKGFVLFFFDDCTIGEVRK